MKLKLCFASLFIFAAIQLQGQVVTGHYGPGLFGLRSAHGFPTDWSYVNVTHIYYAAEMKDNDGKISILAKPINVIANISGGIWGTKLDKINANYNAAVILPFTNLAPNPETLELDPNNIGLGDIKVIPLMLTWNFKQFAVNTRYAFWAPTGSYDMNSKSNKGKGFWSHNLGLGGTVYLDAKKSWNVSLMNTFEFNGKQKGTNITPAPSYVAEYGIGKTFDEAFNMGVIGYTTKQIGKQKGGTIPAGLNNYQVSAVGMEFNYRTKSKWAFITRWYLEYDGVNRPEGSAIRFIFLKNF
ncbi:SphA family protein [Cognatitamlana onchidii]|uniref:SphA family protein n=1 Tax=Cognatitamlana onchidii TaxID=2562860 RepID=UPI0010A62BF8|nr:transporter [Algibacter onchidii]